MLATGTICKVVDALYFNAYCIIYLENGATDLSLDT